jgi:hypothetical protein
MTAMRVPELPDLPFGMLKDLERLYEECPRAMEMFASTIAAPPHTATVGLIFVAGRLQYGELRVTSK